MKYVGQSPPGWSVPRAERPALFKQDESKLLLEPSLSTLASTGGVIARGPKEPFNSNSTPGVGKYDPKHNIVSVGPLGGNKIFSTAKRSSVEKLAKQSPGVGDYKLDKHTIAHRVKQSLGVSMASRVEVTTGNPNLGPGCYNVSADDVRKSVYPNIRNTLIRKKDTKPAVGTENSTSVDRSPPLRLPSKESFKSKSSSTVERSHLLKLGFPSLSGLVEIHDGKAALPKKSSKSRPKSKLKRLLEKRRHDLLDLGPGKYEYHNHEITYLIEQKNSIHYPARESSVERSTDKLDRTPSPGPGHYHPYLRATKALPKNGKFGKADRFSMLVSGSTSEIVGPGVYNLQSESLDNKKWKGVSFESPTIIKKKSPEKAPDPGAYYHDPLGSGLAPGRAAIINPNPGEALIPEHVKRLAPSPFPPNFFPNF